MGVAQFIAGLAFLLFVPAWTLHYWHAWWYIALVAVSVVAITIWLARYDRELLERRMSVGPAAEKERSQKIIMTFASIAFAGMYVLSAFDYRFEWSSVPPYMVEIGMLMTAAGFGIVFFTFKENSYTSGTIGVEQDQQIIVSGPYSVVRHPMYLGGLVLLLGTPIALSSWWGELMFVPLLATIVWRLLEEEKLLDQKLRGYTQYRNLVRYRLIPGIF